MVRKMEEEVPTSEILDEVIDFCHDRVSDDTEVHDYLTKIRGLSAETITKFRLGAFPSNPFYIAKYISAWDLSNVGVFQYNDGKNSSKFTYNRVILPVYDAHGRSIAIMGRCLIDKEKQAELGVNKYDNTRFTKGGHVFGLNLARDAIRDAGHAIVVEGNFDVVTAHQHGLRNVVATSGSWLTKRQVSLLARYTSKIHLMFDNDDAGRIATKRILARMPVEGLEIVGKSVPEPYKDLDEYLRERS